MNAGSKLKYLISVVFILTLNSMSESQVTVQLQQPPPDKLSEEYLWKLTIINSTQNTLKVYLNGTVTESVDGKILDAKSKGFDLPPGVKLIQRSEIEPTEATYFQKEKYEEAFKKTGNPPAGNYTVCIYLKSQDNNQTVSEHCIIQVIGNISSPMLIFPSNNSSIKIKTPTFSWSPPAPFPAYQVKYKIKIVEILGNQSPTAAINNPAFYFNDNLVSTNLLYLLTYPVLSEGQKYAWQVTAIDANGKPIGSNNGKSEIFSFKVEKKEVKVEKEKIVFEQIADPKLLFSLPSTITGNLRYMFGKPPKSGQFAAYPLKNANIRLVGVLKIYDYAQKKFYHINDGNIPLQYSIYKSGKVLAISKTDDNGNFTFNFMNAGMDKIASNVTAKQGGDINPFKYTGDLYYTARIEIIDGAYTYYLNPDDEFHVEMGNTKDIGSVFSSVRSYNLELTIKPNTKLVNPVLQFRTQAIEETMVYLMRKKDKRPKYVPLNEGSPKPSVSIFKNFPSGDYEVIAAEKTDKNGKITFTNLVKNFGSGDTYYIYAETDSTKEVAYVMSFPPHDYKFNPNLIGGIQEQAFIKFNSQWKSVTQSKIIELLPLSPIVSGSVYRKDISTQPIEGAKVEILGLSLFLPFVEKYTSTDPKGNFKLSNLKVKEDDNGNLTTMPRMIRINKAGFRELKMSIMGGATLKLGQKVDLKKLLLDPGAMVKGSVTDIKGNGVQATIKLIGGSSKKTKTPLMFIISPQGELKTYPAVFDSLNALLGKTNKFIIDAGKNYLLDTLSVTVTEPYQNLGEIKVYENKYRLRVFVYEEGTNKTINNANVEIKDLQLKKKTIDGKTEFEFINNASYCTVIVTAPDDKDYEATEKTTDIKIIKGWKTISIFLKKAARLKGKVYAGNSKEPVSNAKVYLDITGYKVETKTDDQGSYELRNVPIKNYEQIFKAVKSGSGLVGSTKKLKIKDEGNYLDFNLTEFKDIDFSYLLGFPIEVFEIDTSQGIRISGSITDLKPNEIFNPAGIELPFNNLEIIPHPTEKTTGGIPIAFPKVLPLIPDINSVDIKLNNSFNVKLGNESYPLKIEELGTGNGIIKGKVQIKNNSFSINPDKLSFQENHLFLLIPGLTGEEKLIIPSVTSNGTSPVVLKDGFQLADNEGNYLKYKLYGFSADCNGNSYVKADSIIIPTVLHSNIVNLENPDINLNIGTVVIKPSGIKPVTGTDKIVIKLENWNLESVSWSITENYGLVLNEGYIKTGTIDIPLKNLGISNDVLKTTEAFLELKSLTLKSLIELKSEGDADFGYDNGKGHWSISVKGPGTSNIAGIIENLPAMNSGDKILINNFYLLSDGNSGLSIYDKTPLVTLHQVAKFKPSTLNFYDTYIGITGAIDLNMPNFPAQTASITYEKNSKGDLTFGLVPYSFSSTFNGVNLSFTGESMKLDNSGFFAQGTLSEPDRYSLKVKLEKTNTYSVISFLPDQNFNFAVDGSNRLAKISGSMSVYDNKWSFMTMTGDLEGTKGASGKLSFTIKGDIVASNQQIGVKNFSSPFGNIGMIYNFEKNRMEGSMETIQDFPGGGKIEGTTNLIIGNGGWYFLSGGKITMPNNPYVKEASTGILIGDYDISGESAVIEVFNQYSYEGKLPQDFAHQISGFYITGMVQVPLPYVPDVNIDLVVVQGEFSIKAGGSFSLGMNFTDEGNIYYTGMAVFIKANAGVGGWVVVACAKVSFGAKVEVGLKGQYKSDGSWFVEGGPTITLSGSVRVGWGVCDSDCTGKFCDEDSWKGSRSVGAALHLGSDYNKFSFTSQ